MHVAEAAAAGLHRVVFGVYRDGDNNLDAVQERNVTDFIRETRANPALKVVAEDTTGVRKAPFKQGDLRTEWSVIQNGTQHVVRIESARDMSSRATLAAFVNRTLEQRAADSKFGSADIWLDLVDHGAGDGGGLESDANGGAVMRMDDIAGAIADGRALFEKNHPGADSSVAGVLANQCLMATLGFAEGYNTRTASCHPCPSLGTGLKKVETNARLGFEVGILLLDSPNQIAVQAFPPLRADICRLKPLKVPCKRLERQHIFFHRCLAHRAILSLEYGFEKF